MGPDQRFMTILGLTRILTNVHCNLNMRDGSPLDDPFQRHLTTPREEEVGLTP